MDHDADEDTIKAVRIALGPDAKCDPYPRPDFRDGAALFTKRHAEKFYQAYPDLAGLPFGFLKKNHHKNPIVQQVVREYSEENKRYAALVQAWRDKWPEDAARVDEARKKSSAQRRERKRRQGAAGAANKGARPGAELPWLTREWIEAKMDYIKKCRETGLKLLYTAAEMQDAYEEHRAFIQELERDREDVF